MRILVISDTHGVCDRVYEVYRKLTKQNPVDYIVHCGDYCKDAEEIRMRLGVPVASVRGNCDGGFADSDRLLNPRNRGWQFPHHPRSHAER